MKAPPPEGWRVETSAFYTGGAAGVNAGAAAARRAMVD